MTPTHRVSADDRRFRDAFEACELGPGDFGHRSHIRLAYIYLAENETETALSDMRSALLAFLEHHGISASKYHETMTRAWILAVRHFMAMTPEAASADAFIDRNPVMLDSKIMMTHYSAGVLFSDEARATFVEPDLNAIPRHEPETR